jgi:hypothetical protein
MIDLRLEKLIDEQKKLEEIEYRNDDEEERLIQVKEEIKIILDEQITDMSKESNPPPKMFSKPTPKFVKSDTRTTEELNRELAIKYLNDHPEEQTRKESEKKRKLTIIEWIMKKRAERRKRNKATPEKVLQLKLEYQKADLEYKIARAKKLKKENKTSWLNFSIPGKIFTDESSSSYTRTKKSVGDNHNEKDYSILTGNKKKFRL